MKNTILFDLDGTLVNSLADLCDSVNYMLDKLNMPARTIEEVRGFVGNGIDMLVRRSVGNRVFDFDTAMKHYRYYYNKNLYNKSRPYEGITDVVSELKAKGFKLGVVTNKAQWAAENIIEHFFGSSFDVVIGADTEKRKKKPDPQPVDIALEAVKSDRESAVFIGDSEVDIATAKNCGMDFIGVSWGFRNEEIFKDVKHFVRTSYDIITLCCNLE